MRIDIEKFLFMGAIHDKAPFYKAAQELGAIEFIHPKGLRAAIQSQEIDTLLHALKAIQSVTPPSQDTSRPISDADSIAERILEVKKNEGHYREEKRVLIQEIGRIAPFGNFSLIDVREIEKETGKRFHFYLAKTSKNLVDQIPSLVLINRSEGMDYFIALDTAAINHPDLVDLQITEPASRLQESLNETNLKIATLHTELRELMRYSTLLHKAMLHKINTLNLEKAEDCSEFELENTVFCVEAWIPVTAISAIQNLANKKSIYFEKVLQEETEKAPTYIHNEGISRVGEDVMRIFDVPSNTDKDPSLWVLFAFSLFFSMIVFDAGYGLIFLAVALYLRFMPSKKALTASTKRALALLTILAISCTLWGGLTHSFFGMTLEPNNFFRKHSLMTWLIKKKAAYHIAHKDSVYKEIITKYPEATKAKSTFEFVHLHTPGAATEYPIASRLTDNVLMELALFLGAIHLLMGLIRYLRKNPVGIGWIAFIIGAYLYLPYYLHATSLLYYVFGMNPANAATVGLYLLCTGISLASIIAIIKHGFTGIFEGLHAIQVFGDVLSYLRIYALGTAAYIVAETVNHMASKAPLFVAIFLIVIGHIINIILSVMGGTIHGLRLNFLEWYRYSFYGGGKNFQPLQLKTLE